MHYWSSVLVPEETEWNLVFLSPNFLRREFTGASGDLTFPTPAQHTVVINCLVVMAGVLYQRNLDSRHLMWMRSRQLITTV